MGAIPQGPPPGEVAGFVGLGADALVAAMGEPAFKRTDGDSQMWRYSGASCRAFFFLYPDSGKLSVRHIETLPHREGAAADAGCLDSLRLKPASPKPVS